MKYSCDMMANVIRKMAYPHDEKPMEFLASVIDGSVAVTELPEFLNGLTEIRDYAFYRSENLALTSLPDSITSIGEYAFGLCNSLTSITLPKSLTSVDNYAFSSCGNLTTVTFKGKPTSIGTYAFSNCKKLTTINVPWKDGEVYGDYCSWGATNATINYEYTGE